jgi:DNA-binding NarL/FixJ family response regulator
MQAINVLIVDDQNMARKALTLLISQSKKVTVIGEACNEEELKKKIACNKIDLVVLDVDGDNYKAVQAIEYLSSNHHSIKVLVLTKNNESTFVRKMIKAGVGGYLTKNSSPEELLNAIEIVNGGAKYLSSEIQTMLLTKVSDTDHEKLTKREKQIIQLVIEGLSSKEISEKLSVSVKTVETHRGNIYKKLNVKNIAELIQFSNEHFLF